ncbi:hypothetical protein QFZ51_001876 [Chitinophaga sp. W3I9]|uniref:hypothetical protein n=1 Tax=Chitinophaga sp. W3I9 TaxID=3373924 RepID=UPI003D1DBF2F
MTKRWFLLMCAAGTITAAQAQDTIPDAARIQGIVNYLASDKLKGRGTAEKGGKTASHYVAKQF